MKHKPRLHGNEVYGSVYDKNQVVFQQGDVGDCIYVIQSGAVEVTQWHGNEETVLAILEQGDVFGEMALIGRQPRSATVTTIQRSRLVPLSRELLLERVRQSPETALHLLKTMIRRIQRADRRMKDLVDDDARLRRMAYDSPPAGDYACEPALPGGQGLPGDGLQEDLSLEEMAAVWDPAAGQVTLEAGDTLFDEGDPGDAMYVVASGRVEISRSLAREHTVLAVLGPSDLLGEMALITGEPRSATARATCDTRLIAIQMATFSQRIQEEPRLARYLLQLLILKLVQKETACRSSTDAARQLRQGLAPLVRRRRRLRVAVVSLSTCGGCASAFLENQAGFESMLSKAKFVYYPMLLDNERFDEADLTLVDGGIRIKEDEEMALEARHKSRWLAAFGTCAAYGGIPALANRFELEDLIEASYGRSRDLLAYYLDTGSGVTDSTYRENGLQLTRRMWTIADHVRVDFLLPGCPPSPSLFAQLLNELGGGRLDKVPSLACAECGRKVTRQPPEKDVGAIDDKTCLMSRGAICMGFLTRGGCGAACPVAGLPCWGCRGLSSSAIKKICAGESFNELLVRRILRICRISRDSAVRSVRQFMRQRHSSLNFSTDLTSGAGRVR